MRPVRCQFMGFIISLDSYEILMILTSKEQILAIKLGISFDPIRLETELRSIEHLSGVAQPGKYHNGEWTGLSLHSEGGKEVSAAPGRPALEHYLPTPLLHRLPYMREIIESLPCPKTVVRLMSLPSGGIIREHTDKDMSFQLGTLRLHVPIVTHPDVEFLLGGQRMRWMPGELWYADFVQPHSIRNVSPIRRVHMIADVLITEDLLALFPPEFVAKQRSTGIAFSPTRAKLSMEDLRRFEGEFIVPRSALPIGDMDKILARIRLVGEELKVFIGEHPLFALEPVAANRLIIRGLPPGIMIECTMTASGLANASLHRGGECIQLIISK